MTEGNTSGQSGSSEKSSSDIWSEVGENFESFGQSLASAFKETWENGEIREKLRVSLDSLADGIHQAAEHLKESEKAQQAHESVEKAAKSAQEPGKQAVQEAKPYVVSSLRHLSEELQKTIDRLEQEESENTTDQ